MVTLLHAEHVYQNLVFVSHAVMICITLTSMICLCQQRYNYIQNTSKRPVYDGHAITCRTRILEPCLCQSPCYHMNTFKCIYSLLITELLYVPHLCQSSVCTNNAGNIFRTLRNIQSLVATLLHALHVYRTLSVVVTLLLYAYHLYQPPVCDNNATIIFRMLRCVQALMVTLLHTEHV